MQQLRTIRGLAYWLVGLLMVAQLAGVVPFPEGHASHGLVHVGVLVHDHDGTATQGSHHHHDRSVGEVDGTCCALHAFLAGVVPHVVEAAPTTFVRTRLTMASGFPLVGTGPGLLDRPPKAFPLT